MVLRNSPERVRRGAQMLLLMLCTVFEVAILASDFPGSCASGDRHGDLYGILLLGIIGAWPLAFVLLIWGVERTVFGLVRLGSLLLVAFGFFIAAGHMLSGCFS